MKGNQIIVNGTVIEASETDNRVFLNGEQIENINDVEEVLHTLIKAVISLVQQRP